MDKNTSLPPDAPQPRLCCLVKWPDFDGYGFNLHGEKSKPGQYIGKVDPDSPAEAGGLRPKDRIIEVNGTNISNENHKQVVQRIKTLPDETKLLVIDDKGEEYYKSKNILISSDLPNVIIIKAPSRNPSTTKTSTTELFSSHHQQMTEKSGSTSDNEERASDSVSNASSANSKSNSLKKSWNGYSRDQEDSEGAVSPSPPPATPSPTPLHMTYSTSSKGSNSSLDLNMTAKEMRDKLRARKADQLDPKNVKMDLRKKYDIIQTL